MKTILFTLLLLPLLCLGQTGSISGMIVEGGGERGGEPLPFTTIIVYQGDLFVAGVQADWDGKFKINDVKAGVYSLKIKYFMVDTTINDIVVKAGKDLVVNERFNWQKLELICDYPIGLPAIRRYELFEPSGMTLKAEEIRRLAY